ATVKKTRLPEASRETDGNWQYFYFSGHYSLLREKRGRNPEKASGFGFGLGRDGAFSDDAPYGFGTYLLFNISAKRFKTFPANEVAVELSNTITGTPAGMKHSVP